MKTSNMTATAYECRIGEIIEELRGEGFAWPESREGDIRACFLRHMTPDEAAAHLLSIWDDAMTAITNNYSIAFVKEDGSWDIVQTFVARDHDAANAWADKYYGTQEWYVLDADGRNINGGVDG